MRLMLAGVGKGEEKRLLGRLLWWLGKVIYIRLATVTERSSIDKLSFKGSAASRNFKHPDTFCQHFDRFWRKGGKLWISFKKWSVVHLKTKPCSMLTKCVPLKALFGHISLRGDWEKNYSWNLESLHQQLCNEQITIFSELQTL